MKTHASNFILPILSTLLFTQLNAQINPQPPKSPRPPKSPKTVTAWAWGGNYKQAQVTKEFNTVPNAAIQVECAYRNIEIKTWDEPKVKVIADYFYSGDSTKTFTDEEALKQAGITVTNEGNVLQIQAKATGNSWGGQTMHFKPENFKMGELNKLSYKALQNLNVNVNVDSLVTATTLNYNFNYDTLFRGLDTAFNNINFNFDSEDNGDENEKPFQENLSYKTHGDSITGTLDKNLHFYFDTTFNNFSYFTDPSSKYTNLSTSGQNDLKEQLKARIIQAKQRMKEVKIRMKEARQKSIEAQKRQKEAQQRAREVAKRSQELRQRAMAMAKRDKEKMMSEKEVKELTDNALKIADEASNTNYGSGMSYNFVYNRSKDSSKHLIIYIPADHALEIDNKYGNISIANDVDKLKLTTRYGNVETENINKLELDSKYGTLSLNNVQNAKLDLSNDRISAHDVGILQVESKYSAVDLNKVDKITLSSNNDDYDIEEASSITGQKDYGNLRISQLNNRMEITGASANMKVRNVSPDVSLIKIENKYADMRIAIPDIKNYNVKVTGDYNTVYPSIKTDQSGNAKIKIDCNSCKIDLR